MPNDIERLKEELSAYLRVLVLPSPKILVGKIPSTLQIANLNNIKFVSNTGKSLSIKHNEQANQDYILSKQDLGDYGSSIEDFRKYVEDIKSDDPNVTLSKAIEKALTLHNKKLHKLNVPPAILAYTQLYEKYKLAQPAIGRSEIYSQIDEEIKKLLNEEDLLTYSYFSRACHGYAKPQGFAYLASLETENLKAIFNLTKELRINFRYYQPQYTALTHLIEELELNICTKNEAVPKSLIEDLKRLTGTYFLKLMQTSSDVQSEKTTIADFQSAAQNLIQDYIKEHPDECKKQGDILARILAFIANLIPSCVLPKDKKMTFFNKTYTETGMRIQGLNGQIGRTVQQYFVY